MTLLSQFPSFFGLTVVASGLVFAGCGSSSGASGEDGTAACDNYYRNGLVKYCSNDSECQCGFGCIGDTGDKWCGFSCLTDEECNVKTRGAKPKCHPHTGYSGYSRCE